MENIKSVVEAIIFASGDGIEKEFIVEKIPELTTQKLNSIINDLKKKYSGDSGVTIIEYNGKVQFASNEKYGEAVAEVLTPLKEKELTKALLEVLSAIAYKQPITKLELDEIRGVSSEYALDGLMKAKLITVVGRRDSVGRPLLYGTTENFLKKFNLETLEDLPDLVEVMEKVQLIYQPPEETNLFHSRSILTDGESGEETENEIPLNIVEMLKSREVEKIAADKFDETENQYEDESEEDDELPDFLEGEEIKVYN